jgi:hypothetical protein
MKTSLRIYILQTSQLEFAQNVTLLRCPHSGSFLLLAMTPVVVGSPQGEGRAQGKWAFYGRILPRPLLP